LLVAAVQVHLAPVKVVLVVGALVAY